MKYQAITLLITAPALFAGAPETVSPPAPAEPWITPTINIRARYEFGDMDGKDVSNAFTFRERLGLKTMAWNGFSVLLEGEFSQAAIDDYSGGAPGADPYNPTDTVIADPETNELNQGYLQYDDYETVARLGRQRIIYDNAAFVGNVGWRQNEQTYDGFSFSNQFVEDLTLNGSYINQVNRIFGSDADGTFKNLPGDIYLLNASYAGLGAVTLGGYAYIMNFDDTPGFDNNTFGMTAKGDALGLALHGELAWQDHAGATAADEAMYGHFTATKAFGSQSLTVGLESLGAGFKTPLATVHAFNGFADVFAGGRISGSHNGLADTYVSHTLPLFWGIKWTNALHVMGDDQISAGYGWEYDSVLAKKFNDNFLAIAEFSHFESEGDAYSGTSALPTTTRFSIELNYTF